MRSELPEKQGETGDNYDNYYGNHKLRVLKCAMSDHQSQHLSRYDTNEHTTVRREQKLDDKEAIGDGKYLVSIRATL